MFSKSKNGPCSVCKVIGYLMMALGVIVAIASLVGVYKAHFPVAGEGMVFGSTAGSLAILAFVFSLFFVKKMSHMCPCGGMCEVCKK